MWKIVKNNTILRCKTRPEFKQVSYWVTSLFVVLFAWPSWDSVVLIFFVLNLAKVQKEAYEKKEKEKAKQARTHVSCL